MHSPIALRRGRPNIVWTYYGCHAGGPRVALIIAMAAMNLWACAVTAPQYSHIAMTTWEERFRPRQQAEPLLERVTVLFRVQGASQRPLRCALYQVATGLELRLEYEDREDLRRSQLFPVRDDDAIATMADEWHRALRAKGFEQLSND